jgi:hypothetical protein
MFGSVIGIYSIYPKNQRQSEGEIDMIHVHDGSTVQLKKCGCSLGLRFSSSSF